MNNQSKTVLRGTDPTISAMAPLDNSYLYSDFNYFFPKVIVSFSLYKLDLQSKYRVSSIEHNSGIVGD